MIEEIKTVTSAPETPAMAAPEATQGPPKAARKPRTQRNRTTSDSPADRKATTPATGPATGQEILAEGPGAGMTREQVLDKWGPDIGQQILDAAAGRKPPFTRDLRQPMEPELETGELTGKQQDRGPVRLLPRPLKYNMEPVQFFKYWAMLSKDELERVKVRPYRLWPVTDVNQLLTPEQMEEVIRKQRREMTKTLPPGPLTEPFNPQQWEAEMYHRYGAGDYNLILTDTHPAVRRTICMTNIVGTLRDMETYPPVLDIRTLVLTDPANESYIRWCNVKGIKVPGSKQQQQEEEESGEMAQLKSIEIVTQIQRDQMAQAREREKELKAELKEANKKDNDTTSTAAATAKILQDAATAGQTLLMESIKQTAKASDPLEYHKNVVEMAKTLVPQNNGGGGEMKEVIKLVMDVTEKSANAIKESNKSVVDMILAGQKALEARLLAAEARNSELQNKILEMAIAKPAATATDASNPLAGKGPMDMLGEMSKMMTTVLNFTDKLTDRAGSGRMDGGSIWARIADKIVDVAPNIMYNYSLARQAAAGVAPGATPQAPPQIGEETDENAPPTEEDMAMRFLDQIEQPLIHSLSSGATGQEFGALLMKTFGADTYEMLAGQSDDAIFGLLKNNQTIWSTVQKMPQRFIQFLQEFRDRGKVTQIFQRMNAMAAEQTQTQPPPRTAPAAPAAAPAMDTATVTDRARSGISAARLRPGQRVVHTPKGAVVVDTTAAPEAQAPPAPPQAPPAPDPAPGTGTAATA